MSNPERPIATVVAPPPRWLRAPRSLGGSVALAVAAYLVWQPFAVGVLLPWLVGAPRPSPGAWPAFLLVLAPLGAAAGALWWWGGRPSPGRSRWMRRWARSTARMLALATLLQARQFAPAAAGRWTLAVAGTAVVLGIMFVWLEDSGDAPAASEAPAA